MIQISAWSLVVVSVQTTDIIPSFGCCTDHRTWCLTSAAALAKDINMASGGNAGHAHQYSFRQQHRPWTPTWPLVVTLATNINTDSDCNRTIDPDLAFGGRINPRHHNGLMRKLRPLRSI